jgi:L-alanine-DL-glutamate epimerase-like enolase superfamily enzyme
MTGHGDETERKRHMKITGASLFEYAVHYLHGEYVMSGGRAATEQQGLLLRLRTDKGIDGWGESTQLGGTYLPTSAAMTRSALEELLPYLIGADPTSILAVHEVMDGLLVGGAFGKSAIDVACWDVRGKALDVPVSTLLGGVINPSFPLYEAVPLGTPDEMATFIRNRRATGVNRFQLKVGNRPEEDLERVRAAVGAGDRDTIVIADANGGWKSHRSRDRPEEHRRLRGLRRAALPHHP